jgi:hypothetical protein
MYNPTLGDVNGMNSGSPSTLDLTKPQVLPPTNPGAVNDDMAGIDSPFKMGGAPSTGSLSGGGRKVGRGRGGSKNPTIAGISPGQLPTLGTGTEPANNQANNNNGQGKNPANGNAVAQNGTVAADAYNKGPLYGFRDWLVEWRKNENNTFDKKFEYSIKGKVDKDGKLLVDGNPDFTGEPQMQELVKSGVEAFSDSGMLKLLKDLQSKNVKISFVQDGNQFNIKLEVVQESDRAARQLFNSINVGIELGKIGVAAGVNSEADPKNKEKEQATLDLLKMAKPRQDGTTVIIDTIVPNNFVESMYQTYKKDLEEKKSKDQGIAASKNSNGTK